VELNELEIRNLRARAPRHRNAVSGGHVRVRGVEEDVSEAAGGQQHGAGPHRHQLMGLRVVDLRPADFAVFVEQEIGSSREASELDVRERSRFVVEGARNFASGRISLRVQHAVAAVRALAGERQLVAFAIELRAPIDELLNSRGAFLHQRVDRRTVAQPVSREQRVLLVELHLVIVAERYRDSALRIFRRGFVQAVFGNDQDAPGLSQLNRGAKAGHAGSDDNEIRPHSDTAIIASCTLQGV
jgi:hypothetical protein